MDSDSELKSWAQRLGIKLVWIGNKDTLPESIKNGCYIVNLQDDMDSDGNDLSGTHWTAFIIDGHQCCYFDPFGFPPPANVQKFLQPLRPYDYSSTQVQSTSTGHCGKYCLYFLYFMGRRSEIMSKRLDMFLSLWSQDVKQNLGLLDAYLKAVMKKKIIK